jgi:hypothetical protein
MLSRVKKMHVIKEIYFTIIQYDSYQNCTTAVVEVGKTQECFFFHLCSVACNRECVHIQPLILTIDKQVIGSSQQCSFLRTPLLVHVLRLDVLHFLWAARCEKRENLLFCCKMIGCKRDENGLDTDRLPQRWIANSQGGEQEQSLSRVWTFQRRKNMPQCCCCLLWKEGKIESCRNGNNRRIHFYIF